MYRSQIWNLYFRGLKIVLFNVTKWRWSRAMINWTIETKEMFCKISPSRQQSLKLNWPNSNMQIKVWYNSQVGSWVTGLLFNPQRSICKISHIYDTKHKKLINEMKKTFRWATSIVSEMNKTFFSARGEIMDDIQRCHWQRKPQESLVSCFEKQSQFFTSFERSKVVKNSRNKWIFCSKSVKKIKKLTKQTKFC